MGVSVGVGALQRTVPYTTVGIGDGWRATEAGGSEPPADAVARERERRDALGLG